MKKVIMVMVIMATSMVTGCAVLPFGTVSDVSELGEVMIKIQPWGGDDEIFIEGSEPKVFMERSRIADESYQEVLDQVVREQLSFRGVSFVGSAEEANYVVSTWTMLTQTHKNTSSSFLVTDGFFWGARAATNAVPIAREVVALTTGSISAVRWTKDMIANQREVSVTGGAVVEEKGKPRQGMSRGANIVMSAKGIGKKAAYVVAKDEFAAYFSQGLTVEKNEKVASATEGM